eukprot:73243-Chlamydomonas_euryale.AAC.2
MSVATSTRSSSAGSSGPGGRAAGASPGNADEAAALAAALGCASRSSCAHSGSATLESRRLGCRVNASICRVGQRHVV